MMTHRSSASSSTYRAASSHHHYQQRDSRPDDPMELGAISTERHHQSNRFVSNRSATPGPSHRRSTTPAPPPRTSTAGLTKLTDADRIVAQAGSTCAPLPQQQPDHLPMSNTTLASPPPPSLPSPLSTANTSPSLSSENFVFTTPAPSAFSPSLLRPLARFIAAINTDSLDTLDGYRHRIHLQPGSLPPTHRLYRMSPAELEELHKQLQIYLEKGWIRPSSSEYGAPVLFARKPDGSLRLCIDYRSLNAQTIKDRGPLPLTSEVFDHLHGAKYFTSLDLWSGYHQCLIHPDDSHKTAFRTRYGLYEFTVMPFGLTNAPAAFMRQMSHVLKAYLDKFVVCYLDDVLIYSKTDRTSSAHQTGLAADPKKTAAVADWPLPSDITSVRSFLGFTGFYRRFIRDYAKIAAPLTDLTRSTVPFPPILPPSAVDSFNQLKTALLSAPLLLIPHTGPDSTFILYTDASTLLGLGAVLLQDQGQGPQPVCYESRKLTPAERNYSTHELELLAIVHAVKIFRHYLEGCQHFTLFTDHHSLRYFFTQKDLSRRQVRWAQDLAVYQHNMSIITIIYKDGKNNHADALSRLLPASLETSAPLAPLDSQSHSPPSPAISSLLLNQLLDLCPTHVLHADPLLDDIKAAYALDPFYADSNPRRPKYLLCRDSLWYFKDRICVPSDPALRLRLLHEYLEYHDTPTSGHPGYLKTLNSIASHYWWPRMTRTVKSYVSSCATCQRIKPSTQLPPGLLQPHAVPNSGKPY
ncbi:hypothetical protein CEUSTIGMA_g7012.t1 [Chlamydomonas eustigma]|uniref:Reverse transcriptase domain-containing protein n=1 Tax=Chlamydomonas eustigma TaxID=1157962 RepID=A0A250X920_9CHLO|nr:hypothetical protein CEUSTIGMA_g7012.t1 [Chlamydomonas eustigma]|eukprot:GAX79571.1 hypothetical protein CEUSTIGMA_g7012.t1 [Chlamydomonas eustigma]